MGLDLIPLNFPLGVGLDLIPLNFPLRCGPGPDPLNFPLGCGPGGWGLFGRGGLLGRGISLAEGVSQHALRQTPVRAVIIPGSATWMHLSLSFPTDTMYVRFGLGLIQILNVDEKAQVIKLKVWERHVSLVLFSSFFFLKKKLEDISPFRGATVCFFIRKIEKV